ncbi:MAG: 5-(carboxyamino)imidazole ribonucleotide synthase [Bacteroidota bacterium]
MLGGGQLGRMLIQSAIDFQIEVHSLDPDPDAPCLPYSHKFTCGKLTDYDTVLAFAADADVVTVEIENVNTDALAELERQGKAVYPQPSVLRLIQDKSLQKQFYTDNGIPTSAFILTADSAEVAANAHLLPAVHKLAREGYDGRGVQKLQSAADLHKAFDKPGVLEQLVDIEKEISVIVARSRAGEVAVYPAVELVYHPEKNLVEYLLSPARLSPAHVASAEALARTVIEKLDMVGLLAVEMFLDKAGNILVNEVAPRPHNSGHQTIKAAFTSQYEQHWRAILGYPLGSTDTLSPSAMVNLLGEEGETGEADYEGLTQALALPGVYPHLYGKKNTKPFRKMGHITILDPDFESLQKKTAQVREWVKVKAKKG